MGNAAKCLANKDQLYFDVAREIVNGAEDWLGKGLLALEKLVHDGEVRLIVDEGAFRALGIRQGSRVARLPSEDELSNASGAGASGSSSRPSRLQAVESASGPFQLRFVWDEDLDCKPFEALLAAGAECPELAGVTRTEREARNLGKLLQSFAAGKDQFVLSLRLELASVSFKKNYSPFRNPKFVEDDVAKLLAKEGTTQEGLCHFASKFGNCIVEKAFCGGLLALTFSKVGRGPSTDDSFQVELGGAVYGVRRQQRGGETFRIPEDGKRPLTVEQLEKQLKLWYKSCGQDLSSGKIKPSVPGRNAAQIIRLKVSPLSKVEGLIVPDELVSMDLHRKAALEQARDALKQAENSRQLPQLRDAVDAAVEARLEDASLPRLQELRRQLDAAAEALAQASSRQDVEILDRALAQSEDAGLPDWEAAQHAAAVGLRRQLKEQRQRSRLQAALDTAEARLDDLVNILRNAFEEGFSQLKEFAEVEEKLINEILELTKRVKRDDLDEEQAQDIVQALGKLPEALDKANLAASRFEEALGEMHHRLEHRRKQETRKAELEHSLQQLVQRAEVAESGQHDNVYQDLQQVLQDVDELVGPEGASGKPGSLEVGEALKSLRRRGLAVLEEKRAMDATAQQVEARLREATQAHTSTPETLESGLRDVAVKQRSGALRRAALSEPLLEAARKQLCSLLQPQLEEQLRSMRRPGAVESGEWTSALADAKHTLQRMEDSCQPTCDLDCQTAARRLDEAEAELQDEQQRHRSQVEAREKLIHFHDSGDPDCLEASLQEASQTGVAEVHTVKAQAKLRELRTAERQVHAALKTEDRVHLTAALEEAARQGLKTAKVDEALQKLQSSKTNNLVAAIRQRDYHGLKQAICEAEARSPEEVAEVADVLSQAKEMHKNLDLVAAGVSAALSSLKYDDLQNSIREARQQNIVTDDVKKAEGVLAAMDTALEKLRAATDRQPRDLGALQESLHSARQLGLQAHPVYRQCEEVFAGTCMPPGFTWALAELRTTWVLLCLRQTSAAGSDGGQVRHAFAAAAAEVCHSAQISAEADPYSIKLINLVLLRITQDAGLDSSGGGLAQLQAVLQRGLEDLSSAQEEAIAEDLEAPIDAKQFNRIGVMTKGAGLDSTSRLLWSLVCIVEWQTGHRLLLDFMGEQFRRTADLITEAESTSRSLKTHMTALQAKSHGTMDDEGGAGVAPEVAPEGRLASASPAAKPAPSATPDPRVVAAQSVLDEIEHVKREAEKLQASLGTHKASSSELLGDIPDLNRILELLCQACPRSLEEARSAIQLRQLEASGRAREICGDTYCALEVQLLQLQYKGRQALDGEAPILGAVPEVKAGAALRKEGVPELAGAQLPLATYASRPEGAGSLLDHAFLQLLGTPEGPSSVASLAVDRCFRTVEIYDRFSEKTGTVEDEFEKLCRGAVTDARQRCGGRRLIAALKPLLVDLVKRRQRISSILNTLRNCGLDKIEKNLLRKHLQPRDVLIALAFSSMPPGPSQARMMSLASKTDSPLPLLFGWAAAPGSGGSQGGGSGGLQLCSQIQWGALRELFCSPSYPLVLSLGTGATLGKSYLLQYLYALQECHFRSAANTPLRIHAMPSIDIIGDFAREEAMRGVTLADVHGFDAEEELCEALTATLSGFAALALLHCSLKADFVGSQADCSSGEDSDGAESAVTPSPRLRRLLEVLSVSEGCPTVLLLLRDADFDEHGPGEARRLGACVESVRQCLAAAAGGSRGPEVLAWPVPPLAGLGPTELSNEVKTLRKNRAVGGKDQGPSLEEALAGAALSSRMFPSLPVLQQRYEEVAESLRGKHSVGPVRGAERGALAARVFDELGPPQGTCEGLLQKLFPVAHCHQQLTVVSQEKVRCLGRGREYLEPEERQKLESTVDALDKEIARLRRERQQAQPHPLLRTFAQLVVLGDLSLIVEFGACLDAWKQAKRAPLLENKLKLRKELDKLVEAQETGALAKTSAPGVEPARMTELRAELAELQKRLDEVDVSTDSFWLEIMSWHELERVGARRGLREVDERITFSSAKACYLNWVKGGNPMHFLHSAPLQFGAFEPLRWHPQLSGASFFGSDFLGDILRELDRNLGVDVKRRPLLVISVIGVQSSGKSTLMNYLFGCSFVTHVGRCTKGLYISLLETQRELVVVLDTEGLLSVEARDDVFDKQVALMTMACSDLVIVNNRGELGRHVGDLFQVCLFALYHLKLARISPAIGFVLQCLSMVNQQQQYEWVATVKRSLEDSVQELQQKEKPHSFQLQDLVFLDSESIFVMPSAFNDDVQFGLQVSRPTNLYALKALQLREKVFHWISRAKASQRQRWKETGGVSGEMLGQPEAGSSASFASLSQWYDHARTVWQTLSMCGTDLLQFRTMRQVLMAQQLQEFCDALVQKHVDGKLNSESEVLIERYTKELRETPDPKEVHAIDNAFRGQLDGLRDAVVQEMQHDFDEFVKSNDSKFTDEQVKSDKRFSLMGPMRRKYASVDSLWRSAVHLALEQRSMDNLFQEISARVKDLLLEQGASVNVQNVERVFEEKWSQVMAETLRKQKPHLEKVLQEVVSHFNAALLNLKSQFRKAHIFHGVKSLSLHEVRDVSENACNSFLLSKKGVGAALIPSMTTQMASAATTHVDNLWIKLIDTMRLEVDQQGQMSDAAALKILNRLNSEMDSADQLRQLLHRLGSSFVQRLFCEMAKATIHYRFQIEQQNFQSRVNEIMSKKQQKLWEIQARVDSGKREVHCAKVWAKTFVDTLDQHFRNAVGRMAQEVVSHMSNILTNPGTACESAIERSFTKRNWRHVVMYAIDPTQYLFMEFHKEWDRFKQALVDQYCQELKSNFGSCIRIAEERMNELLESGSLQGAKELTMNKLSKLLEEVCSELADESVSQVLCSCLPTFQSESDWNLNDLPQFVQFASVELRRYRANMHETENTVERRMEAELTRQKADFWKCISGCPARCPGCGTKCNLEHENHWPERPHECRRHLYPAFNGWQKQEGRKPFLLHCRASAQWKIARTRPPIEPGGPERYWDNFQAMLEDEHPDWLDPSTRMPLSSMEPLEEYEEDCDTAPEDIQKEIEENRRAWANCKDALLEHFTSMADDTDITWLEKYKREGGALTRPDFVSIRDELFAVTPLESLENMDSMLPLDETVF